MEKIDLAKKLYLQIDIVPFYYKGFISVKVTNLGFMIVGRVKVGHKGSNVLCSSQPRVNIVSRVQEASCGYCYIFYFMTIKRKSETNIVSIVIMSQKFHLEVS